MSADIKIMIDGQLVPVSKKNFPIGTKSIYGEVITDKTVAITLEDVENMKAFYTFEDPDAFYNVVERLQDEDAIAAIALKNSASISVLEQQAIYNFVSGII